MLAERGGLAEVREERKLRPVPVQGGGGGGGRPGGPLRFHPRDLNLDHPTPPPGARAQAPPPTGRSWVGRVGDPDQIKSHSLWRRGSGRQRPERDRRGGGGGGGGGRSPGGRPRCSERTSQLGSGYIHRPRSDLR
ncbi:hypothetical protein NHX12_031956 [Muraenolepis orangiensis]|uniref:Uncharacterized protein n=1 Tax=Muraenolepis orangiensis TaxID=630683 RepID=A0A9Q0E6V6_9TELE|nr:hypothetical protein NHX12_031956 [Muraenolepis orangiensis]